MDHALIDLHVHTSASDGTFSPREVVFLAHRQGLKAIAITDHDTIAGNESACEAGREVGVEVIPGVEISVEIEMPRRPIHILGYFIDHTSERLHSELTSLIRYREERNPQIIQRLNSLGVQITYEEVKTAAGPGTIGRPHVAQVLVQKGYVKDGDEAFKKYLRRGAPAYVEKKRLSPEEGITLIRDAGGIPVLAHPFTIEGMKVNALEAFILRFREYGIQGVEVYYSLHTSQQTSLLETIARKHSLLTTGGSDFHGDQKPKVFLGKGFGKLQVPYELVTKMKQLRTGTLASERAS
jgi:3',5'-nucleoside bisphosphate phosphatase